MDNCPTCGMRCTVEGRTTKHYEPVVPTVEQIRDIISNCVELSGIYSFAIMFNRAAKEIHALISENKGNDGEEKTK